MLVLTRRPGESLKIGNDVTIKILEANGNQVRIGIDAPKGISVHREEIYQKVVAEREAAAQIRDRLNKTNTEER